MSKQVLVKQAKRAAILLGVVGIVGGSVLAFDSYQRQQAKAERLRSYPQSLSVYECTALVFCSFVSPVSLSRLSLADCEREGEAFVARWIADRGTSILTRYKIQCDGHNPNSKTLFDTDYN